MTVVPEVSGTANWSVPVPRRAAVAQLLGVYCVESAHTVNSSFGCFLSTHHSVSPCVQTAQQAPGPDVGDKPVHVEVLLFSHAAVCHTAAVAEPECQAMTFSLPAATLDRRVKTAHRCGAVEPPVVLRCQWVTNPGLPYATNHQAVHAPSSNGFGGITGY